ncbi:glycosyl hydrolase [Dyadobacter sp. CY312]|uniref:glycosyl hydrolase n=1 Tax=Dyadobacter sp. CY312 TaxID=2907303 RepID=UPI001F2B906B|nr:glycosyl hydrolase [Dyadobacter sp. CY312]MCE7043987.1 glycoside hydrolase [Dyadobacter sp. CY312]
MRYILFFLLTFPCINTSAQNISTAKPWTYWWWMGSAVKKQDITKQLEIFQKAGVGGVHIIPIYGAKGAEADFIPFLSPKWLDMMQHTVGAGKRLGLGVDMTTGTGWPFGGPNIPTTLGAKQMEVIDGEPAVKNTKQMVKRAAPGGEGLVFDPYHKSAMSQYLTRFDSAFANTKEKPRSMYMDSYEAYGANWTEDFLKEFEARRGYDLKPMLSLLKDSVNKVDAEFVRMDYKQTLAELLRERYANQWAKWSKDHNFLTRYQAHGSPGNLLDLYDEADIPETESFGTSRFSIPGLRVDTDYSIKQFGTPNPLAMKFASSAAHFSGKKLVSSETATWLANHFKVSLSQIKPQIDQLFVSGINHIFYHGTTYSPIDEAYPGWLFYASTNFGPTSHFAEHFSLLNKYVENCQTILQDSKPDNDVLVYFPIHDLWAKPSKSSGGINLLEVHHVDRWLLDLPFGKLSQKLWNEGYSFDYVSDRQLDRLKIDEKGNLASEAASYKTLLIPAETYMPAETLNQILRLARAGGRVIFQGKMPDTVTGMAAREERQKTFTDQITELKKLPATQVGDDVDQMLLKNGVVQEELAKKGLTYIRKKNKEGKAIYFVSNLSNRFSEGWITLGKARLISKNDPMSGKSLMTLRDSAGISQAYLKLLPGQSCFLEEASEGVKNARNPVVIKRDFAVNGTWDVTFLKGRPSLPKGAKIKTLDSWTQLPDSAVYFSGTAKYTVKFDVPKSVVNKSELQLDLGDVREVASIKINGEDIGTYWSIPFIADVKPGILKTKGNLLEIEVTNLSANYMRLRDKQTPDWKKFYDINVADITYKPFDASAWKPMPSGLLGPVKIIYNE